MSEQQSLAFAAAEAEEGAVETPRKRRAPKARSRATAQDMAKKQREISVSEFFTKNRHLLGFDNPRKALLTTVKEAVDNSLDACEEAGILPERARRDPTSSTRPLPRRRRGQRPGHREGSRCRRSSASCSTARSSTACSQSRGQQGIGISAAGMYGQLTTGKPVRIVSRTGDKKPAHLFELVIDTATNKPAS